MPGKSLFQRAVLEAHGENDVYFSTDVQGRTVVSYFADGHQTGNEAKREMGTTNRKITADRIAEMHKLADRVRGFYGDAAVGTLPPLPKKRQRRKAA